MFDKAQVFILGGVEVITKILKRTKKIKS